MGVEGRALQGHTHVRVFSTSFVTATVLNPQGNAGYCDYREQHVQRPGREKLHRCLGCGSAGGKGEWGQEEQRLGTRAQLRKGPAAELRDPDFLRMEIRTSEDFKQKRGLRIAGEGAEDDPEGLEVDSEEGVVRTLATVCRRSDSVFATGKHCEKYLRGKNNRIWYRCDRGTRRGRPGQYPGPWSLTPHVSETAW